MLSFNVNGQALDMPANLKLQFQKKNILFSFDNVEIERTTSFSIPKTPRNVEIFGLSNMLLVYGQEMRMQLDAVLFINGVVKTGVLYITKYSVKNETFECVFLTGSYFVLKTIKNAGKLKDFYFPKLATKNDVAGWASGAGVLEEWKTLDYEQVFAGKRFPSYNLKKVIEGCFAALGLTKYSIPNDARLWRAIPSQLKRGTIVSFNSEPKTGEKKNKLTFSDSFFTIGDSGTYDVLLNNSTGRVEEFSGTNYWYFLSNVLSCKIDAFRFDYDVRITFPDDFPTGIALVKFMESSLAEPRNRMIYGFLGDYIYDLDGYTGTWQPRDASIISLGGTTVTIPANTNVGFVRVADGDYIGVDPGGLALGTIDTFFRVPEWNDGMPSFSGKMTIEYDDQELYSLYDNLEERTLVDILKDVAILDGSLINVENEKITLDEDYSYILTKAADIQLKNVLSVGTLQRSFLDYAQQNIVKFEEVKEVKLLDRLSNDYRIDNVNISQQNILQTIGYSEGNLDPTPDDYGEYRVVYPNTAEKQDARAYVVARSHDETLVLFDAQLLRMSLPSNLLIERLVERSTSIDIVAKMAAFEFEKIQSDTVFWYGGARWLWTQAKWSDDKVELQLAMI